MCSCDADAPDIYTATMRTARKDHQCSECCRAIARGDSYEYVTALYDGSWSEYRTCRNCVVLRGMAAETPCHTELHECWWEEVRFGEWPEPKTPEQAAAVGWAWGCHYGHRIDEKDWRERRLREYQAKRPSNEGTEPCPTM